MIRPFGPHGIDLDLHFENLRVQKSAVPKTPGFEYSPQHVDSRQVISRNFLASSVPNKVLSFGPT